MTSSIATVKVHQADSFKLGIPKWGNLYIDLDHVLSSLTEDERVYLHTNYTNQLCIREIPIVSPSIEIDDVVKAIRNAIADIKNEEKRIHLEKLNKLNNILENPDLAVFESGLRVYSSDEIVSLADEVGVDPEPYEKAIVACSEIAVEKHKERVNQWFRTVYKPDKEYYDEYPFDPPIRPGAQFAYRYARVIAVKNGLQDVVQRIDEYDAALNAAKTVQKDIIAASEEAWFEWIKKYGSDKIKAAIVNDYPLGNEVKNEVVLRLTPERTKNLYIVSDNDVYDAGDCVVPEMYLYEEHKNLTEAVASISPEIIPYQTEIIVGRIRSIYLTDDKNKTKRSAIPITVKAPHYLITLWYTECKPVIIENS